MRKLIVQQWVTADTMVAEEDGGLGFVSGDPVSDATPEAFKASLRSVMESTDTLLLGANTYLQSRDYWPFAAEQGEYGEWLNQLTKYVASSTLTDAPWGDYPAATVTRDPAETVRELKQRDGKNLWLWGSLSLMRFLLDAGLVDEFRLMVCPVALGRGTRLFADRRELRPVEATLFDNGVVLQRWAVDK